MVCVVSTLDHSIADAFQALVCACSDKLVAAGVKTDPTWHSISSISLLYIHVTGLGRIVSTKIRFSCSD